MSRLTNVHKLVDLSIKLAMVEVKLAAGAKNTRDHICDFKIYNSYLKVFAHRIIPMDLFLWKGLALHTVR